FLYAFILMHFVPSQNKSVNEKIDKWLRPALKDMEACVEQFKRDEFEVIIQSLLEDREAAEENIKKLKRHNTNLKKKKKKLQTELNNVLTSKSWRMTAPLRKLMEWGKESRKKYKKE